MLYENQEVHWISFKLDCNGKRKRCRRLGDEITFERGKNSIVYRLRLSRVYVSLKYTISNRGRIFLSYVVSVIIDLSLEKRLNERRPCEKRKMLPHNTLYYAFESALLAIATFSLICFSVTRNGESQLEGKNTRNIPAYVVY